MTAPCASVCFIHIPTRHIGFITTVHTSHPVSNTCGPHGRQPGPLSQGRWGLNLVTGGAGANVYY